MTTTKPGDNAHPHFDSIVSKIIESVDKERLGDLRRDFHTRLRITLTQPESSDLIEDLWDFFYDWCVFEQNLPEIIGAMPESLNAVWIQVRTGNQRGLFSVQKVSEESLKLKELYSGNTVEVPRRMVGEFVGIERGDIIEGRLVTSTHSKEDQFCFVRRPSFHPLEVHDYIKKKVKEFKKSKDFTTYQTWLWLLVGMYLKHRIYQHMPIEKIYDDNSRI